MHCTDYKIEDIRIVLEPMLACIRADRFAVDLGKNRTDNIDFITEFRLLTKAAQKDVLLCVQAEDFCHSMIADDPKYKGKPLYVFCPTMTLQSIFGIEESVDIYIKLVIVVAEPEGDTDGATTSPDDWVISVSLHKRKYSMPMLFDTTTPVKGEFL